MITRYSHRQHYQLLQRWFDARGIVAPRKVWIPDCGFISNEIAIGFLVKTDTPVAYFDNIIASPDVHGEERDAALLGLFEALEAEAQRCGYQVVQILSCSDRMSDRLSRCGFRKFGEYTLMFKEVD